MRNQHQLLLLRLYRISQNGSVEDYVQRYSDLVDQICAYDTHPDHLNFLTRFLDGLKPAVQVLVAIQQPSDLDTAYTMALIYEELGDGFTPWNTTPNTSSSSRRATIHKPLPQLPAPPSMWISKTVEEKKNQEAARPASDDKWTNLKAYRRAKGHCFVCGEKWEETTNAKLLYNYMLSKK
jgi:hypothetical protein